MRVHDLGSVLYLSPGTHLQLKPRVRCAIQSRNSRHNDGYGSASASAGGVLLSLQTLRRGL
eukprot:6643604-Alexandrium_andersonii.AAC.1